MSHVSAGSGARGLAAFIGCVRLPRHIDLVTVQAELGAQLGQSVDLTTEQGGDLSPVVISIGSDRFTIIPVARPIPPGELALAVQTAYGWRGAGEAVAKSGAHIIVASLSTPPAIHDAVKTASLHTALVAAILRRVPTSFVYWADGDSLSAPEAFAQSAKAMIEHDSLPILSWVQFRLFPGKAVGRPGSVGIVTTGLSRFSGYELEVAPIAVTPADVAQFAVRIVDYIIRDKPVMNDGDRIELEGLASFTAHPEKRGVVSQSPTLQVEMMLKQAA